MTPYTKGSLTRHLSKRLHLRFQCVGLRDLHITSYFTFRLKTLGQNSLYQSNHMLPGGGAKISSPTKASFRYDRISIFSNIMNDVNENKRRQKMAQLRSGKYSNNLAILRFGHRYKTVFCY